MKRHPNQIVNVCISFHVLITNVLIIIERKILHISIYWTVIHRYIITAWLIWYEKDIIMKEVYACAKMFIANYTKMLLRELCYILSNPNKGININIYSISTSKCIYKFRVQYYGFFSWIFFYNQANVMVVTFFHYLHFCTQTTTRISITLLKYVISFFVTFLLSMTRIMLSDLLLFLSSLKYSSYIFPRKPYI